MMRHDLPDDEALSALTLLVEKMARLRDWTTIDKIGQERTRLDEIGRDWKRLDKIGRDWARLDESGQEWTRLDEK